MGDNLKYQKRYWFGTTAKVYSVGSLSNRGVREIVFYRSKDKLLSTVCFGELASKAGELRPNMRVKIWIDVKSKQYQNRWYHDVVLHHYELPVMKAPTKEQMEEESYKRSETIKFNEDF